MHKNATKCNKTQSKWCINKHGASKIIDTFETYQLLMNKLNQNLRILYLAVPAALVVLNIVISPKALHGICSVQFSRVKTGDLVVD
jgi:hypothetical protein